MMTKSDSVKPEPFSTYIVSSKTDYLAALGLAARLTKQPYAGKFNVYAAGLEALASGAARMPIIIVYASETTPDQAFFAGLRRQNTGAIIVGVYSPGRGGIAEEVGRRMVGSGANAFVVVNDYSRDVDIGRLASAIERAYHRGASNFKSYFEPPPARHLGDSRLTAREKEVLQLIVQGVSNKEVAASLEISVHTVKDHIRALMQKMNLDNRTQIAVVALAQPEWLSQEIN